MTAISETYNPDVLTCLANLSNDEVFTPPAVANDMLDLLPKELWSDPNAKFLDPASKSGVFLREIAKRLMTGLEDQIPDTQERINHIYTEQLYGISITELTALLSRRSLYCSKFANGKYSIVTNFNDENGNIDFTRIEHKWFNDRCLFCGASQAEYDRSKDLETHAYKLIHTNKPEELYDMKFDVVIGNPPYQISDGGGTGDSAKPIYQLFVQNAIKLAPRYLVMIIPSRWMKGGKGLDVFREKMMNDKSMRYIYDYQDASQVFPGVHIDGGVNYFLWDRDYAGKAEYHYVPKDGVDNVATRYLKVPYSEKVIRDNRQITIIEKVFNKRESSFDSLVSARNPYGFSSDLFNHPHRYPEAKLTMEPASNKLKIYGVKGKKGGAKRMVGYINPAGIPKSDGHLLDYKLFFSKAYTTTATVPPKIIIGEPNTLCTETFLQIGPFKSEQEASNCLQYISTKFFRALLLFNRHSLNMSRDSFSLIPLEDLSALHTDEQLYEKYGFTTDEIEFIEENIQPMEISK